MEDLWQHLPDDVALHIISFVDDIDTRRAFGFGPRKLPPMDLPPFQPTRGEFFKYFIDTKSFLCIDMNRGYYWHIIKNVLYDPERNMCCYSPSSRYHSWRSAYPFGGWIEDGGPCEIMNVWFELPDNIKIS